MKLLLFFGLLSLLSVARSERVMAVSTHTDCCLSRSLDNDNVNWIPGQTDTFTGESSLLECAEYEIGSGPFVLTAFHDGVNGLVLDWIDIRTSSQTVRCEIDQEELDDHSFTKATCS